MKHIPLDLEGFQKVNQIIRLGDGGGQWSVNA